MSGQRLRMDEFSYELPASAIAHVPTEPRDAARLLVDRGPAMAPEHRRISDLGALLEAGDLLVVNETRVMPARLPLRKRTGGAAEVLLLEPLAAGAPGDGEALWAALVRPSRRIADGMVLVSERDPNVEVAVGSRLDRQRRAVRVLVGGTPLVDASQARLLERAGEAPLPPYIDADTTRSAVAQRIGADALDGDATRAALADRYQTVYARADGSSAAPTAGLHLTERVLDALRSKGVGVATVDLTVGLATFAPVTAEHADEHEMHTEHYRVPAETLAACAGAERVVAVGTTTVRALEAAARQQRLACRRDGDGSGAGDRGADDQCADDVCGSTDLFLQRGEEFLVVDAMLTNFHLPRSSLLLLIDAFIGPRWRDLYEAALAEGYRFLSFGDAMLLHRGGGQ
ncbi:tRNA preQ1(34) S-adenosylmethionine ribosyltransferase-isomerase QueA [Candidatus Poriferisodalis sp.]|uniref:tRNA preQ1(34) S-adenosylmethionine ribosyltransferase-isomerase QueA n=1 Tax=Candidatus Poriferisodalis sp. TaxID=3101277 RepID=UPI003B52ABB4